VTTATVTVIREIEEDKTVTCWDWCGEGASVEHGPLIEYVPDTADADVTPPSEI
jgi:hypothetical protein